MNLLAGEHGGKSVVIFGSDLGKESPVGMPEEIDEKHAGGSAGLTDGFGCPMLPEFYEEEVVAQLSLGDRGRIAAGVLVDEPELAVVGVPGTIGVIAERQVVSKPGHRRIRMLVIHGVGVVSRCGLNRGQGFGCPQIRVGGVIASFF